METIPKNIKEFKALIERYESITLAEIEEVSKVYKHPRQLKEILTGFGNFATCTLCNGAKDDLGVSNCSLCIWWTPKGVSLPCYQEGFYTSYIAIEEAKTPEKLKEAYLNRAKVMRQVLTEKNIPYADTE